MVAKDVLAVTGRHKESARMPHLLQINASLRFLVPNLRRASTLSPLKSLRSLDSAGKFGF